MDPAPNGALPAQIKLAIIFTPNPSGQGGELQVTGIPDNEPMGYWLLKKLEHGLDSFYTQRNQPKVAPVSPGMLDSILRRRS